MNHAVIGSLIIGAIILMGCTTQTPPTAQHQVVPVPGITTTIQISTTPSPLPVIPTGSSLSVAETAIAGTYRSGTDNYYSELGIVSGSLAYSSNCPGSGSICRKVQLALESTSPGVYVWKGGCCEGKLTVVNATHLQMTTSGSSVAEDLYRVSPA